MGRRAVRFTGLALVFHGWELVRSHPGNSNPRTINLYSRGLVSGNGNPVTRAAPSGSGRMRIT